MREMNQVPSSPSAPRLWTLLLAFALAFTLVAPIATAEDLGFASSEDRLIEDASEFAEVVDPALPYRPAAIESRQEWVSDKFLDFHQVFTVRHTVPIGQGEYLAVTEAFTLRSWLRFQQRAVVFLPGSVFRGNHWSIPVEGYDGMAAAARRGFFAYSVDYLGVGDSTRPANGLEATLEANTAAMQTLLRYIRVFRPVNKVDLVGEGYGGSVATMLGADSSRVRSVTMSAMIYREVNGGPLSDPFFLELLRSMPDGYFFIPGESSGMFLDGAPPTVFEYVASTQGGLYPTLNFLVAADRPYFNPRVARVPGLVLYGPGDFIAVRSDVEALAREYGRNGAILSVNQQAGHAPRTQGPAIAEWYWTQVFDFIDP
jgi:pimeloyl-ACP methyl ester carboxylesterase